MPVRLLKIRESHLESARLGNYNSVYLILIGLKFVKNKTKSFASCVLFFFQ